MSRKCVVRVSHVPCSAQAPAREAPAKLSTTSTSLVDTLRLEHKMAAAEEAKTVVGFLGWGEIGSSVGRLYDDKDMPVRKRDVFQVSGVSLPKRH